jgi:presequence protease
MTIHGFELIDETPLPEHKATGVRYRHEGTGTDVFHVRNDDRENLFGFAFKTLPPDSTGVAHILEHAVLSGSRSFPLKDPFILLVKGSLNTFLNAMTYPDKTVYPASSTVEQDLFNILRVYGDAVFFPLLKPEIFRQEGHRLIMKPDGRLEIAGIVYNEMKGTYANHDSIAGRWAHRALLPDTPYGFDSGGDPAAIPDLTYEDFLGFHRTYYHPSNARIFLYGNIPTDRYLDLLNRHFLSHFGRLEADLAIPDQPRWAAPREVAVTCPADSDDSPTSITMSWLLGRSIDPTELIAHEMLSYILLGTSAGPLRRALIESDLGEDLSAPTGLETDLKEMIFSAGLRGTRPDAKPAVEQLILDAIERIAHDGIDRDIVEGAFRTVEFRNREIKGGGPNGLRLMGRALRGWLHGAAPHVTLQFEDPFGALRARSDADSRYFETLLERSLLGNPHRATVTVRPDPGQPAREAADVAARLERIAAAFTDEDRRRLGEEHEALERLQSEPDPPQAIAKIPFLGAGDLPREVERIPTERRTVAGVPTLVHDVFANGVVYLDLTFDISGLPAELMPFVPLYVEAVGELGLPGRTYDQVATEIALKMGGYSSSCEAGIPLRDSSGGGWARADLRITFRIKVLESTVKDALDLAAELLLETRFEDTDRLEDLVKEARSSMSGSVLPGGHRLAAVRAGQAFSDADWYEEQWGGASQLLFLHGLSPGRIDECSRALRRICDGTIRRGNLFLNVTGDDDGVSAALPHLERFAAGLPDGAWEPAVTGEPSAPVRPRAESLVVPADVAYVAAACRGARLGSPDYVHEEVLAHLMRTGYLWETIRMKGGAYGASASARGLDAVFGFWSYRDPQIGATLSAFRTGLERLATVPVPDKDLELAIIGVTGHHIRPFSPGEKGIVALRRALYGIPDELRQSNHELLLRTSADDIRRAAARILESMADSRVVVVAGADALSRASGDIPGLGEHQTVLPV